MSGHSVVHGTEAEQASELQTTALLQIALLHRTGLKVGELRLNGDDGLRQSIHRLLEDTSSNRSCLLSRLKEKRDVDGSKEMVASRALGREVAAAAAAAANVGTEQRGKEKNTR